MVAEVLAIHTDQIERYGGATGIRDLGLLEAALFRPQTGYYSDLSQEAAALWESLGQTIHLSMAISELPLPRHTLSL